MVDFFRKKKKQEENTEINQNENEKSPNLIDEFFDNSFFYTYKITPINKTQNYLSKKSKYFTQLINDTENQVGLFGIVYTDKKYATKYLETDLKNMEKEFKVEIIEVNIEDIFDYLNSLSNEKVEGIMINYPYNWQSYKFK